MYIYDTETDELLAVVRHGVEITGDGTLTGIMLSKNGCSFFFKTTKITVE